MLKAVTQFCHCATPLSSVLLCVAWLLLTSQRKQKNIINNMLGDLPVLHCAAGAKYWEFRIILDEKSREMQTHTEKTLPASL